MNKLTIIGNLTKDPELRTTPSGINVCSFTVAVNRRVKPDEDPQADFFNVTAWRALGENCSKYLAKGRKVCIVGPVSIRTYSRQDGSTGASMDVTADDVEFLSPKGQNDNQQTTQAPRQTQQAPQRVDSQSGMQPVAISEDELPF